MIFSKVFKFARTYATNKVSLPIHIFGVEGRYATALYSAAVKLKQLDAVEKDVNNLKKVISEDPNIHKLVSTATDASIKELISKINATDPVSNFLHLLVENGRVGKLEEVLNAFSIIMGAHRRDLICEVITAQPLDAENKTQLQSALKLYAKKGENIVLELKVDPNLLGGMIAMIGDHYIDMSISSKIKKYTELITERD